MDNKETKKHYQVNSRPIICLLIGLFVFTIILMTALMTSGKEAKQVKIGPNNQAEIGVEEEPILTNTGYDRDILAVVTMVDYDEHQITLLEVFDGESVTLTYTGGSNIIDKYGQVISIKQLEMGVMVDVAYQSKDAKLVRLQVSNKSWEYVGVNNHSIDLSSKIMKIADTKYRYTDKLVVMDRDQQVWVDQLASQDELTVRGYEEMIYSITITRGHGSLRIKDEEAFLGSYITVGYEAIQQIAENMVIVVREGRFNLTVESDNYTATKQVVIERNKETIVSLADMGPTAQKSGQVTFKINPFGADLFIDGKLTSYANPVKLAYGNHKMEVSLGGYTTYRGSFEVEEAGKVVVVDLPEAGSGKEITVTQEEEIPEPASNVQIPTDIEDDGDADTDIITDEAHQIHIQNPLGASVYIDGEFKGISPVSFQKIIGTHVITFIKDNYKVQSYTLEIADDGKDVYLNYDDLIMLE